MHKSAVAIFKINFVKILQSLLHKQEILEKNFRNQLREESKRRKTIVDELRKAEKKINDLGKVITVSRTRDRLQECQALEWKKIKSRRAINSFNFISI